MENTSPVFWLTLSKILDNPYQPRQYYAVDHILNLAHSIAGLKEELPATLGLQQLPLARAGKLDNAGEFIPAPHTLYKHPDQLRAYLSERGACVQLAFGHSRLRAFMLLADGPSTIFSPLPKLDADAAWPVRDPAYLQMPLVLGFADDKAMWTHAVTENAQRKNITAIEEARTLQQATEELGLTLEEAGKPFGYAKSTVSNKMRLLRLPDTVQAAVAKGEITERHARELLRLEADPEEMTAMHKRIGERDLTVKRLADEVSYAARLLKEKQEKQRELDAAKVALAAGWKPPGSDEPLGVDRVCTKDSLYNTFNLDNSIEKALLYTGKCGKHCPCFMVGYSRHVGGKTVQPDPTNAPNVHLGCIGGWDAWRAKRDELKTSGAPVIPTDAEVEAKRIRAEQLAQVEALNSAARALWTAGLAQLDLDALLTDMNFWRLALNGLYSLGHLAERSETMAQFRDNMLEALFQRQQRYSAAYNESVAMAADIEALLSRLKGEEVKAEAENEDEQEEEEEDDNAWYDEEEEEEEEDEEEAIPEF
jgi:ParB-like chromosome segregation protein Spo0J